MTYLLSLGASDRRNHSLLLPETSNIFVPVRAPSIAPGGGIPVAPGNTRRSRATAAVSQGVYGVTKILICTNIQTTYESYKSQRYTVGT